MHLLSEQEGQLPVKIWVKVVTYKLSKRNKQETNIFVAMPCVHRMLLLWTVPTNKEAFLSGL